MTLEAAVTEKGGLESKYFVDCPVLANISYYYPIRLLPEKAGLGMSFGSQTGLPAIATD